MDAVYSTLAAEIIEKLNSSHKYRILVFIAGTPGSGKSTVAQHVKDKINLLYNSNKSKSPLVNSSSSKSSLNSTNVAVYPGSHGSMETSIKVISSPVDIPSKSADDSSFVQTLSMDGFHYPRYILDKLPNPQEMHKRRGAPFTFDDEQVVKMSNILSRTCIDAPSSLNLFQTLPSSKTRIPTILLPSFDHSKKDPKVDDIEILPTTRIIIIEGLYMLLNTNPWRDIYLLNYSSCPKHSIQLNSNITSHVKSSSISYKSDHAISIYINVSEDISRNRVAKRHIKSGICNSLKDAIGRFDSNDAINGRFVDTHSFVADIVVSSINE